MHEKKNRTTSYYREPSVAASFHDDRYGGTIGAWFLEAEREMFGRFISLIGPVESVIDLGSGTGKLSRIVETNLFVCLDSSLEMLRMAPKSSSGCLYSVVGDSTTLPFEDTSFDLVLSSRLLMHIPEWRLAISECCRIARKAVIIDFPTKPSVAAWEPRLWSLTRGSQSPPPHRIFGTKDIMEAFREHGFHVGAVRKGFLFPYRLHRMIGISGFSRILERFAAGFGLTALLGSPACALFQPAAFSATDRAERD